MDDQGSLKIKLDLGTDEKSIKNSRGKVSIGKDRINILNDQLSPIIHFQKSVRKWEKRWVLVPNVFQFGEDVWVYKWVSEKQIEESNQLL